MRSTDRSQDKNQRVVLLARASAAVLVFAASQTAAAAVPPGVPERQSIEIARVLRPIPDEEWQTIAGERVAERYEIVRGDTLFDISRRLFGDARYWPKIWALNNNSITNPHLIKPGKQIAFLPGTGVALPSVAIESGSAEPGPVAEQTTSGSLTLRERSPEDSAVIRAGRSQEWKELPNQSWELLDVKLPSGVDPLGFSSNTRIHFGRGKKGFQLRSLVQSERLDFLGELTGGREESTLLSTGDVVYIASNGAIQVGETYDLTHEPILLKAETFGRTGYSYPLLGSVRITGVKDQVFIGTITTAKDPIPRGSKLIIAASRVTIPDPVPGPGPIEGTLLLDKSFSSYETAQHNQAFVDRGSDDGVQPGMVFRLFEYKDPATKELISESGLSHTGDLIVIQVSPRFSTAMVISSRTSLPEKSKVILLTDISEVFPKRGERAQDVFNDKAAPTETEIDTLEGLDGGAGLGKGEARELRQLEEWKEGQEPPPPTTDEVPPTEPEPDIQPEEIPPPPPLPEETEPAPTGELPAEDAPPEEPQEVTPDDSSEGLPPPPPTAPEGDSEEFPPPPPME